jgi:hypothetical protein
MKNLISRILSTGLLLGLVVPSHARQPLPTPAPKVAVAVGAKGRVLVFKTERTLSGEIELVGDCYRVRRVIGETWIPAEQVEALCGSLDEAYQFLRKRANLNDPDERLRLADWCRQHALREQAINEVREAANLRPQDERVRRMLAHLETSKTQPVRPASAVAELPAPRIEVTADSATQFAVRVQPILMNACVKCHNTGRGGQFQLTHASGGGLGDRRTVEKNLAAVLDQINTGAPRLSKLLTKAVSIHGRDMVQAPLNGRDAVAFRTLEQWVNRTVDNNPQLAERAVLGKRPAASPSASPKLAERWGADRAAEPAPRISPAPAMAPPPAAPVPTKPAIPDPVDPEGFNREFHAPAKPGEGRGNGS